MYNPNNIVYYTENFEPVTGLFAIAKMRYSNLQNDYFILFFCYELCQRLQQHFLF